MIKGEGSIFCQGKDRLSSFIYMYSKIKKMLDKGNFSIYSNSEDK